MIGLKNKNLVEDVDYSLAVKFHQYRFSSCRGEVEMYQSEARAAIFVEQSARQNTNLVQDAKNLLPDKFCLNLVKR